MTVMPASTTHGPALRRATGPAEGVCVAAVQLVSGTTVEENLDAAAEGIARAAGEGARLVALPEYFCLIGRRDRDKVGVREQPGQGPIQDFLARQAQRHGVWLVGGTLPLAAPDPERVYNTVLVFDPQGRAQARYDKIHLFAFQRGEESYDEARTIVAGSQPVAFDCAIDGVSLRVGLSVCYDLRFPELYRQLGACDLLLVPAAFTATTGRAHWHALLRARAIENLAYVLAPAQGGEHANGRQTFGHSLFVDPWGEVLAELETGPGVVTGHVDPQRLSSLRGQLPALEHRCLANAGPGSRLTPPA
jgi:nitrilase